MRTTRQKHKAKAKTQEARSARRIEKRRTIQERIALRAQKDRKLGVLPLGEAVCDECPTMAFTRWYANHGTKREEVAHTVCEKHNDELLERNAENRKRLGLDERRPETAKDEGAKR